MIFWGVMVVLTGVGVVAQRRGWIDLSDKSARKPGGSGSYMSIGDEVFHPTRHEAQQELDRQSSLPAPAPVPGDGAPDDIYAGRVRIRL